MKPLFELKNCSKVPPPVNVEFDLFLWLINPSLFEMSLEVATSHLEYTNSYLSAFNTSEEKKEIYLRIPWQLFV